MPRRGSGLQPTRRRILEGLGAGGLLAHSGALGLLVGCDGGDVSDDDTEAATALRFAVISDMHLKDDPQHVNNLVLAQTVQILNAIDPPVELVLLPGDLLDDLPSDDPAYYEQHDETQLHQAVTLLAGLQMPWLAVLGNHDYYLADGGLTNELTEDFAAREALLEDRLGLPGLWFRRDHRGIALYGLSSMQRHPDAAWIPDNCGSFGVEQLAWLDEQLADGTPAVLFFHHPLALDNAVAAGLTGAMPFEVPRAAGGYAKYEGTPYEGWTDPIYELLGRYSGQILAIFVGHGHWFVRDDLDGAPVMMTDSVGNSVLQTSVGEGDDASPMRYHLVDIDPDRLEVVIANADLFSYDL
jgi:predicted MPP superfamily phosphohydrolase